MIGIQITYWQVFIGGNTHLVLEFVHDFNKKGDGTECVVSVLEDYLC